MTISNQSLPLTRRSLADCILKAVDRNVLMRSIPAAYSNKIKQDYIREFLTKATSRAKRHDVILVAISAGIGQ
jgi:hypothetical protein